MTTLQIANPQACGMGEGARCCAFLAVTDGFVCGRTVPGVEAAVRARLAAGTMQAQYDPGALAHPDCQERRP